jgi:hypothetical protein
MSTSNLLLAGLVLLSAASLVTWVWFAMARVDEELRRFSEFEGLFGDHQALPADPRDGVGRVTPA